MKQYLLIGLVSLGLMLSGCGGGSSGGTVENNNTYDLTILDTKTFKMNINGNIKSATETITFTGFTSNTYLGTETVNNSITHKSRINSAFEYSNGNSINNESIEYNKSGWTLKMVHNTDGYTCYLTNNPDPLPTNANIGYVSSQAIVECDNGNKQITTVSLDALTATNAQVKIYYETFENEVKQSATITNYELGLNNEIIKMTSNITYVDGLTGSLYSISIEQ